MTQPAAISTIGVRHGASFDGAGAAAVDMKFPGQLRERIGAPKTARRSRSFSHRCLKPKAKLRDGFDFPGTWVHG
jgi:hypothetical protein